jgi:hypothetical protein
MIGRLTSLCLTALLLAASCDDENGNDEPTEDQAYFCENFARHWCPALLECDPDSFSRSFHSYDECVELTERDCLEPPPGQEPCRGVTQEGADTCVAYIESNFPEGCWNLFGVRADMSPCEEDICD